MNSAIKYTEPQRRLKFKAISPRHLPSPPGKASGKYANGCACLRPCSEIRMKHRYGFFPLPTSHHHPPSLHPTETSIKYKIYVFMNFAAKKIAAQAIFQLAAQRFSLLVGIGTEVTTHCGSGSDSGVGSASAICCRLLSLKYCHIWQLPTVVGFSQRKKDTDTSE